MAGRARRRTPVRRGGHGACRRGASSHEAREKGRAVVRAVLDPNVLVSSQLSPNGVPARLLSLAERNRYEMVVSESLIGEIRDVLWRPKFRRYLPEEAIPSAVRRVRDAASLAEEGEIERLLDDPKDDYLIALALASGADVVVSGDRHLNDPPHELPVRVIRPADFLAELENDP